MGNPRVEKLRAKSREVKNPVTGNLDKDKQFVFDKHKEKFFVIARIPVRTIKVGTKSTTQRFDDLAKLFVLSVDDYEDHFVFSQRFKNTRNTVYVILHDPTEGNGKAVPVGTPKAPKIKEPKEPKEPAS